MRIRRQASSDAMIPTASMADIAFLLIIFFMVTTVQELDRTSVNLPLAKIRQEAGKGSAIVVLGKEVDDSGAERLIYKFSDGQSMSQNIRLEDLYLEASRLTYADKSHEFILKADGTVRFEKIDEILDAMRRGNVQEVLLLTHQKTDAGGAG